MSPQDRSNTSAESHTLTIVILVLAIVAAVLGYFLVSTGSLDRILVAAGLQQQAEQNAPGVQNYTPDQTAGDANASSGNTNANQRAGVLDFPAEDASDAAVREHQQLVEQQAVATTSIRVTGTSCNIQPTVARVSLQDTVTFQNETSQEVTIALSAEKQYTLAAGEQTAVAVSERADTTGAYGFGCPSERGAKGVLLVRDSATDGTSQ